MKIQSEKDFDKLRDHVRSYRKKFPEFRHDVDQMEQAIEKHMKQHSQHLISFRQSKKPYYLEYAQKEIDAINKIVSTVEKVEIMAYLSQR
jgi:predicted  nucleic acid-binding Zn-ribbon protein